MTDLIFVDVERLPADSERVTLIAFDLKEGKSTPTIFSGYNLADCSKEIADKIASLAPVQIIVDEAGLGMLVRETIVNILNDEGYEVASSGHVSVKEKKKRKKVTDETN